MFTIPSNLLPSILADHSPCLALVALKADDIAHLKRSIGFDPEVKFFIPQTTKDVYGLIGEKGAAEQKKWDTLLASYSQKYPTEHAELTRRISGQLPSGWEQKLPVLKVGDPAVASRKLSENVLTAIHDTLPELFGGSADLTGSNLTRVKNDVDFQPPSTGLGTYAGRYFRYGVREHAMGSIMNGLAAYGAIIPFGGTFLVSLGGRFCVVEWKRVDDFVCSYRTSSATPLVPFVFLHSVVTKLSGSVSNPQSCSIPPVPDPCLVA